MKETLYSIIEFFSSFFSKIYYPHRRILSEEEIKWFRDKDRTGNLILVRPPWYFYLSSMFIPGWAKHAMVVAHPFIVHSTVKEGTKIDNLWVLELYPDYMVYAIDSIDADKFYDVAVDIGTKEIPYDHRHTNNKLYDCVETALAIYIRVTNKDAWFNVSFPKYPDKIINSAPFKKVLEVKDGKIC